MGTSDELKRLWNPWPFLWISTKCALITIILTVSTTSERDEAINRGTFTLQTLRWSSRSDMEWLIRIKNNHHQRSYGIQEYAFNVIFKSHALCTRHYAMYSRSMTFHSLNVVNTMSSLIAVEVSMTLMDPKAVPRTFCPPSTRINQVRFPFLAIAFIPEICHSFFLFIDFCDGIWIQNNFRTTRVSMVITTIPSANRMSLHSLFTETWLTLHRWLC